MERIMASDSNIHAEVFGPDVPPPVDRYLPNAPLLDSKSAAALLNVPATWVLAEARADRIPHVRLGRYVRFDAAELQSWWQSRRRGPWRSPPSRAEASHNGSTASSRDRQAA